MIEPLSLQTTPDMVETHAALVHDFNPLHLDADFAKTTAFGGPIVHGSLLLNLLVEAIERSGPALLGEGRLDLWFSAPVSVGDRITAAGALCPTECDVVDVWVSRGDGMKALTGTLRIRGRRGQG